MDAIQQAEIAIILWMQAFGAWMVGLMQAVTMLGSENFYFLVMPALYWCLDTALGVRVAVMLLLSNGIGSLLKMSFRLGRPYWIESDVTGYAAESSFGLPSGHAQNAASLWGLMAASTRNTPAKVVMAALIFLIGLSRVMLGVHFLSDVLAGWLVGGLLLYAFLRLDRPVTARLRGLSFRQMAVLAVVTAAALAALVLVPAAFMAGWQAPAAWEQNAVADIADSLVEPGNIESAFTLSGTWLGIMLGVAWLYHRQGGFNVSGPALQRLLRYLLGVAGVLALWFGLGQVFPDNADALSYSLRFLRYLLTGLWVSAGAPMLFEGLGLAGKPVRVPARKMTEV